MSNQDIAVGRCPSLLQSVSHVRVLYRNNWRYRQTFFSAWFGVTQFPRRGGVKL